MKVNRTRKKTADAAAGVPFRDRPVTPPVNRGRAGKPFTQAELADWVRKAKDLPDIRWDKVQKLRQAIQSEAFDLDERLAKLGDKLPAELIEYLRQLGQ
jgi:hypothetical protein